MSSPPQADSSRPRPPLARLALARALAFLAATCAGASRARAVEVTGELALTSDYVFRGVSQTEGGPAAQAGVTAAWDPGWYVSGWASNVEFGPDDPAQIEVDVAAGWSGDLPRSWTADVSVARYVYPRAQAGDYTELLATFEHDERLVIQASASDDELALGGSGFDLAAGLRFTLPREWKLQLLAGQAFVDALPHGGYSRAEVHLRREWGALELDVAAHATRSSREAFGDAADPRVVATLTWSLPP